VQVCAARLPASSTWLTFERSDYLCRYPATVETAGLRLHSFPADVAFDLGRVEARVASDRHELVVRALVAPANSGNLAPVGAERPIGGLAVSRRRMVRRDSAMTIEP